MAYSFPIFGTPNLLTVRPFLILLMSVFGAVQSFAQGIEFFHGSWEEALMKAKAEDRIIFVDAYTTWCGPCKRMAASTFPDPAVGEFFNQHFISMKIDMEKEMGLEFKKKFPVSSYPTLFFIDADQQVVQKAVGARGPADLITLAEEIIGKYDKSTKYAKAYEAGDRSYQLVYDYIAALNKSGKASNKIANDYLATQTDVTTPENLKLILEAAAQVDCQCFDIAEKYKKEIIAVTSSDAFQAKVRQAANNTVKRAIEFESEDLVILAGDAMKRHIPGEAEEFKSRSAIKYALALHNVSQLDALINAHVKKFVKNDPALLNQIALDIEKYVPDHAPSMTLAVDLAGKAAKSEETKHIATYATLVQKTKSKEEAVKILDEALKKYEGEAEPSKDAQQLKALKNKIQNS
jgi:thiol-disulfide isomerase/thioredoxin